jgi:hypothetical protein
MNKLIEINDEKIRHNSVDLYSLCVYSKNILKLDHFRIQEYWHFRKKQNSKLQVNKNLKELNILIAIPTILILIYRFKSFLIIPSFFGTYYFFVKPIFKFFLHKNNDSCYFCYKNKEETDKLDTINSYSSLIDLMFKRDPKISSLRDLEAELDKYINEKKINLN